MSPGSVFNNHHGNDNNTRRQRQQTHGIRGRVCERGWLRHGGCGVRHRAVGGAELHHDCIDAAARGTLTDLDVAQAWRKRRDDPGGRRAMLATLTHGATLVLQGRFEPGESLEAALGRADAALYCAKNEGRNRIETGATLEPTTL